MEEGGADGALARAMLSTVFRMLRLRSEATCMIEPRKIETQNANAAANENSRKNEQSREREHDAGVSQSGQPPAAGQPWSTALDSLVGTVATNRSSGNRASRLGFAERLVPLFCDQDDALVDMLLTNLQIFHGAKSLVSACFGSATAGVTTCHE